VVASGPLTGHQLDSIVPLLLHPSRQLELAEQLAFLRCAAILASQQEEALPADGADGAEGNDPTNAQPPKHTAAIMNAVLALKLPPTTGALAGDTVVALHTAAVEGISLLMGWPSRDHHHPLGSPC
jgi:hypothetical protein